MIPNSRKKIWVRVIAIVFLICFWYWLDTLPSYCREGTWCLDFDGIYLMLTAIACVPLSLITLAFLKIRSKKIYIKPMIFFVFEAIFWVSLIIVIMTTEGHWGRFKDFLAGDPKAQDSNYRRSN